MAWSSYLHEDGEVIEVVVFIYSEAVVLVEHAVMLHFGIGSHNTEGVVAAVMLALPHQVQPDLPTLQQLIGRLPADGTVVPTDTQQLPTLGHT